MSADPYGWTHVDFSVWLAETNLTLEDAALTLGVTVASVYGWNAGRKKIKQPTVMACMAVKAKVCPVVRAPKAVDRRVRQNGLRDEIKTLLAAGTFSAAEFAAKNSITRQRVSQLKKSVTPSMEGSEARE